MNLIDSETMMTEAGGAAWHGQDLGFAAANELSNKSFDSIRVKREEQEEEQAGREASGREREE